MLYREGLTLERTEPKINGINHKNEIRIVKTAGNIKMTVGTKTKICLILHGWLSILWLWLALLFDVSKQHKSWQVFPPPIPFEDQSYQF